MHIFLIGCYRDHICASTFFTGICKRHYLIYNNWHSKGDIIHTVIHTIFLRNSQFIFLGHIYTSSTCYIKHIQRITNKCSECLKRQHFNLVMLLSNIFLHLCYNTVFKTVGERTNYQDIPLCNGPDTCSSHWKPRCRALWPTFKLLRWL